MWWNTFNLSNISVRVFLKWSKATATAYSHHLYPAGCWDLGTIHPKTVYICQYYGFTTIKMSFYWLIILNNIILMINNDQSTIIEAPEVYKSTTTHFPSTKPTTKKLSTLTPLMDMLWSILLHQTFRISYSHYEFRRLFGSALVRAYKLGPNSHLRFLTIQPLWDW